jgi:hypothetical protein
LLVFPQLPIRPMSVDTDFDGRPEVDLFVRFDHIAVRFGEFRTIECGVVGIGGQINERHIHALTDSISGFDAIDTCPQRNVHQNQIGQQLAGFLNSQFARGDRADDDISQAFKLFFDSLRDYFFVFDD